MTLAEYDTLPAALDDVLANVVAIVCDWNGTIVDDTDRALHATNRVLLDRGVAPLSGEEFCATF